eukprot:CAMPEP_0119468422 /NCGR_PEP_ID=MMETSP1344-20130328/2184_1 /TAXON_ID=236787 /ORGANISM="Florenciella parvula, Strain CCMP2471" /LENGTH=185 /DNA_ID=CAMNT_0007500891 /DNA_START=414 /DNA_END=971 /DNA_ORIENTATION=+
MSIAIWWRLACIWGLVRCMRVCAVPRFLTGLVVAPCRPGEHATAKSCGRIIPVVRLRSCPPLDMASLGVGMPPLVLCPEVHCLRRGVTLVANASRRRRVALVANASRRRRVALVANASRRCGVTSAASVVGGRLGCLGAFDEPFQPLYSGAVSTDLGAVSTDLGIFGGDLGVEDLDLGLQCAHCT